jgi:ribosomal protein S18 acetylase RimI-like enzyme
MSLSKTQNVTYTERFGVFLKKGLGKILRSLFQTNNATWYKKELRESNPKFSVCLDVKSFFSGRERLIKWLRNMCGKYPWIYVEREIQSCYEDDHLYPYVLFKDDIIGYIKVGLNRVYVQDFKDILQLPPKTAFIYDTFVLPEYRGKHIASLLVEEVSSYLFSRGYDTLWCHIPKWNTASIKIYQRAGFKEISSIRFIKLFHFKFFYRNPEKMMHSEASICR